jgi:biotin carboxyl carrier protein
MVGFCRHWALYIACMGILGCAARQADTPREKRPIPVTVMTLQETSPGRLDQIAGSVASWKTENIGFEVSGRVRFVVEPDSDVEGLSYVVDDKDRAQGTVVARLDPERYDLAVNSALAQLETTKRQRRAVEIEVDDVIPAQGRAAIAERTLASNTLTRNKGLFDKKVITKEQLDESQAKYDTAVANVSKLAADRESKKAELTSFDAKIEQQDNAVTEAERDRADCELRSFFRGQVAEVHVIPGGFVERGNPVLTVQMMDPIKIEFEVSASTARTLNYRDRIPVSVPLPDGSQLELDGGIYMIDPTANLETRTFTVTVLTRNQRVEAELPPELKDKSFVRTQDQWQLQTGIIPGTEGGYFVEENSIQKDAQGKFLWKIVERTPISDSWTGGRFMKVEKIRITVPPESRKAPFLDIWTFEEIVIDADQPNDRQFDPLTDIVVGKLIPSKDADQPEDGGTVLFERNRWLLRPGDLVRVALEADKTSRGFYVPMNAIKDKAGSKHVMVVEDKNGTTKAKLIPVNVHESHNTSKRVTAVDGESLQPGMSLIVEGVHYLVDAEPVSITTRTGAGE